MKASNELILSTLKQIAGQLRRQTALLNRFARQAAAAAADTPWPSGLSPVSRIQKAGIATGPDGQAADVVQLKPSFDPVWGGMLLRVKHTTPGGRLRGYLLIPHRGGQSMAWCTVKACEVTAVGRLTWPEAAWGFRPWSHPS